MGENLEITIYKTGWWCGCGTHHANLTSKQAFRLAYGHARSHENYVIVKDMRLANPAGF